MTKQMGVPESGITVLMNLLAQDVGVNQYLRELTKNSMEAMDLTRHPDFTGPRQIIWTYDEMYLMSKGVYKACVVDTGVGMLPHELEQYINNLSSSGGLHHGLHGNYGMGAKIAALTVNHHGVIYQSWKHGKGYMIHMWKDPKTGQFGLREFDIPNTKNPYIYKLPDSVKPKEIDQHGTKVILLGMREDENTFSPIGREQTWIPRYLNSKFYLLPGDIEIKFASLNHKDNRTINGMRSYLLRRAEKGGALYFDDVTIRWWILPKDGSDSRSHQDRGHVAAIYQDELYDIKAGRSAHSALAWFGIAFGAHRVVIYAEPKGVVTANTSRSNLILDYDPMLGEEGKGEPLPWEDWGKRFYQNMPQELQDLQAEERGESGDNSANIRDLLSKVKEFFDIPRKAFRPGAGTVKGRLSPGETAGDDPLANGVGEPGGGTGLGEEGDGAGFGEGAGAGFEGGGGGSVPDRPGRRRTKKTSEDNPYCKFENDDSGEPHVEEDVDGPFPQYQWIDDPENHDLEKFAAVYNQVANLILINRKFGGFVDLREKLLSKSTSITPIVQEEIKDSMEKWFGLSMVEAVVGINSVKNIAGWTEDQVKSALSKEALTTMCMQRYFTVQYIRRETNPTAKYSKEKEAAKEAATV